MSDEKLTPEQEELQAALLAEFMNSAIHGHQAHFAARAEILRLQKRVEELEAKPTRGKREKENAAD